MAHTTLSIASRGKKGSFCTLHIHTYIRFNEKISQDTQDQRPLTCDLNTKEIEKQLTLSNSAGVNNNINNQYGE